MSKKTFNIFSICIAILLITFVVSNKKSEEGTPEKNIIVENQKEDDENIVAAYQDQVLKSLFEQNVKSFEEFSESFKRKPTDTLSDTIAKNTFAQYINYNTTETLDAKKIQEETVAALRNNPVSKSNIQEKDILLSADTITELKRYVNDISIIQTEMNKSIYKAKDKKYKEIYIKNIYKAAAKLYKKVLVPRSILREHLGIINGYYDYALGFELLELQTTDPAKAIAGVQVAKEAQDVLVASFESVKNIVLLNNIRYTQNDPAYVWFTDTPAIEPLKQ